MERETPMCILKVDGEKVKMFTSVAKAEAFAKLHCKYVNYEICGLTETALPKASRMHYNEDFENYGAYKYNPFALLES